LKYYPLAVATVLLTYCVAVAGSEIVLGSFEKPAFCKNVQEVTYIMPMATTAVTTLMIGHTAWYVVPRSWWR
jgi:hypothetical protein